MNYRFSLVTITILLVGTLYSQAGVIESNSTSTSKIVDPETEALEIEQKKLSLKNTLQEENFKREHADLLTELQKIKLEKEILSEKIELENVQYQKERYQKERERQEQLEKLQYNSSLLEAEASKLDHQLGMKKLQLEFKEAELNSKISMIKIQKERASYIDKKPIYLDNPLSEDNKTLIISDRRIDLNGVILRDMANMITTQINYYNNKDNKKPIFIVIDSSGGGSIVSGYRILKAMESSKAPIYVVLKSYAASMAAIIVALADKSFAYSHATILHHQPASFQFGFSNLTEQKEKYEDLKKWWKYFATPIAKKMGITIEEYKEQMYKNSSKGNWREFAVDAQKIKWVNHIIEEIEETSILKDPLAISKKKDDRDSGAVQEELDKSGKPVMYLPHLSPVDGYLIYNPDGYYQMR